MLSTRFIDIIINSIQTKQSNLCVGLDSRYDLIPTMFHKNGSIAETILFFNQKLVEVVEPLCSAFKMNVAFYAGFGAEGLRGLKLTNEWLKKVYPHTPLLADCKRSEMGASVKMIDQEIFEWLKFDCVMVTPWFGFDTVKDYLRDDAHGVCVYVHDSNPTASEFQDLELKDGTCLYECVTDRVVKHWNANGNVFIEAGATYPTQLVRVREIVGDEMVILAAGIGPQGAVIEDIQPLVYGEAGLRLLVNMSRKIIFPETQASTVAAYTAAVSATAHQARDSLRNNFNRGKGILLS